MDPTEAELEAAWLLEKEQLELDDDAGDQWEPSLPDFKPDEDPTAASSLSSRLLLCPNKAGTDGTRAERERQVVFEASKGSKFFLDQEKKDKAVTDRIAFLKKKMADVTAGDMNESRRVVESVLAQIERRRRLDRVIVHVDMVRSDGMGA
ncbi:hypothetical protein BDK51DRAFT_47228 [Blyttiomyces helicus]|uniref:Uncharacterized protein n=1 Tax=Blyttiomyces helicus TaxID=388810 RepID=A0A4P9W7I9_9FUNG|nr:hypothetical protein BDK51DRAFT_47228 [Blyttiomyces helicus]|eukprot:RKO86126.1 hypothetical protein BDK51DRAFT_47228 [Blyttiomyces helicus]